MNAENTDPAEAAPERTWWGTRTKRIAIAAAVAVAIGGGGAVALAATGDESGPGGRGMPPGAAGMYPGMAGPDGSGGGGTGPGPSGQIGGIPGALHGEVVAADGSQYVTYAIQTGQITALDDDSVTMTSVDGYSREYLLGDVEPDGLEVGDQARVLAVVEGESATVERLTAATGSDRRGQRSDGSAGPGMPPGDMGRGGR